MATIANLNKHYLVSTEIQKWCRWRGVWSLSRIEFFDLAAKLSTCIEILRRWTVTGPDRGLTQLSTLELRQRFSLVWHGISRSRTTINHRFPRPTRVIGHRWEGIHLLPKFPVLILLAIRCYPQRNLHCSTRSRRKRASSPVSTKIHKAQDRLQNPSHGGKSKTIHRQSRLRWVGGASW